MNGMIPGKLLYFLQGNVSYFKEDDPLAAVILGSGLVLAVIITLLINRVRNRVEPGIGGGKEARAVRPRKFTRFTLRRIANSYGLNRDQTKLLEYVFRLDEVEDPLRVLNNPALLDRHFRQAYRAIERTADTEEDVQVKLTHLFSLRNVLDAAPRDDGKTLSSTHQITENAPVVLSSGKDSYSVKLISAKADAVLVECPRNSLGNPVRLANGTKISLTVFTHSSRGFSFESRVMGTVDSPRGLALQCAHSNRIKSLAQRRFRRKQVMLNCVFLLVVADETKVGRKKVVKLVADRRRHTGTILDISMGGCSVRTTSSIPVGSRLKITINSGGMTLNALGQVLRTNRSGAAGAIMHVKFLRLPRRAMNAINAMVFGFAED
ncbi:MAG: flagellar brake protein [Treponema sp.]|jgi:c-di-GMP-binding flagellar brake protein YcgR|nr:flagellar brake protein [Treponema sp.]